MRGYSYIVRFKFNAGILLGMLAAFLIIVTDLTIAQSPLQDEITSQTAPAEDGEEESQTRITAGKDLVASVTQLTLHHTWHFIASIHSEDTDVQESDVYEIREYNTWFRTVFRLIISPNAP